MNQVIPWNWEDRQWFRDMMREAVVIPPWVNLHGFWIEHNIGNFRIPLAPRIEDLL